MNPAEIVVREMQRTRGFQIRQFLAESIRQPREPANRHSHGEVLPFDKASRDVSRVRIASTNLGYNLHDFTWGVPRFGALGLAVVAEQLHKLRKVYVQPERIGNASGVVIQAIRCNLRSAADATVQVPQETSRIFAVTLANVECRNQFSLSVYRNDFSDTTSFSILLLSGRSARPFTSS